MDGYEDGNTQVRVNDARGSDLPLSIEESEDRRVSVPRQSVYVHAPTSKNYDFEGDSKKRFSDRWGAVA